MAFEKGKSGNPNGRKQGSQNKATAAVKERIEYVLGELDNTLLTDLAAMQPAERVELWAKLQEFIRPKLSRTTLAATGDGPPAVVKMQLVTGYLDAAGQYVECPPLRNSEKDIDLD